MFFLVRQLIIAMFIALIFMPVSAKEIEGKSNGLESMFYDRSQCRLVAQLEGDTSLSFSAGSDSWSGSGTIECMSPITIVTRAVKVCYFSWYSRTFQHINLDRIKIESAYIATSRNESGWLSEFELKRGSDFTENESSPGRLQLEMIAWPGIKNYSLIFEVPEGLKNSKVFNEGSLTVVKIEDDCSEKGN